MKNSAIHDCVGECVHAEYADHVVFDRNIFYSAIKHHIFNLNYKDWTITNNLFVLVKNRPLTAGADGNYDPVAHIYMYTGFDP